MFTLDRDRLHYGAEIVPSQPPEPARRILVAGDLCPQGRPETLLLTGRTEEVWGDVATITGAHDLNIVNLECPLTCSETPIVKVGPHVRSDPRCAAGIRAGGFHIVTLANNHIMDMGEIGLQDTLSACQAVSLQTVGAGRDLTEATRSWAVTIKGLKVALLAFAEHEFSIASDSKAGVWPLDLIDNYHQLAEARKQADFVLVVLHGGNEGFHLPSPRLIKTCRFFAEAGAGAVICHHSHAPSGMEVMNGVPILYGTGNLLFDSLGTRPASWYTGYMVSLEVLNNTVTTVELIPYVQCLDKVGVRLLQGKAATEFLQEILKLSTLIQDQTAITRAWQSFCEARRSEYLARLVACNWLEEQLWARQLLPQWLIRGRIPNWLGLIRCQAHHEVLSEILQRSVDEMT